MGYSKEIYSAADKMMERRRTEALNIAQAHTNEVYSKIPRIEQISRELSTHGIAAAKAVLKGADAATEISRLRDKSLALQAERSALLNEAGYPENYLEPHFVCERCCDKGAYEDEQQNKTLVCSCYKRLLIEVACAELNRISPLQLSTFEGFRTDIYPVNDESDGAAKRRMEQILDFCRAYAAGFSLKSKSILMRGATGLGKTHLSLAIANEVIKKGFGVVYVSAPSIFSKLEKEHFSYRYDDEQQTETALLSCDLLIIDDLGTEFLTSFSKSAFYNIFNNRLLSGKPTVINTNLTLRELEENYSQRFVSRIGGEYVKLDFLGKDARILL